MQTQNHTDLTERIVGGVPAQVTTITQKQDISRALIREERSTRHVTTKLTQRKLLKT